MGMREIVFGERIRQDAFMQKIAPVFPGAKNERCFFPAWVYREFLMKWRCDELHRL